MLHLDIYQNEYQCMFENLVLRRSFRGKNSDEIFGATISYQEKNSPSARKIAINIFFFLQMKSLRIFRNSHLIFLQVQIIF